MGVGEAIETPVGGAARNGDRREREVALCLLFMLYAVEMARRGVAGAMKGFGYFSYIRVVTSAAHQF